MDALGIEMMAELSIIPEEVLKKKFGDKTGRVFHCDCILKYKVAYWYIMFKVFYR